MNIKKIALIGALLAVLLGGAAVVAGATPLYQAENIPPRVVETLPLETEELSLDQDIVVFFDQAMDMDSVVEALSVTDANETPVTSAWEDDVLILTPLEAWGRGDEITVDIATTATSAAGVPLADPIRLRFMTIGFIEVSSVIPPPDAAEIASSSTITVIFNRPIVPLVTIEEQADLPNPLVFDPPIAGEGEWLNTSIYVFTPTYGIPGGVTQSVTVPSGLTSAEGALLEEAYTWSFETLRPQVIEVYPRDGQVDEPLDRFIRVDFSQAMDTAATEAALTVRSQEDLSIVTGTFEWERDDTRLVFTADELLDLGSIYEIIISEEVAASATGAPLISGWVSSFATVPYPAISSTSPADGNLSAPPYGGFEIYFTAPIDADTLEDKVVIEPEPWREFDTYYYEYNNRYGLFFDVEPSTDYTITILPGIADPYGNTIDDTTIVRYRTGDYDPALTLNVPEFVGLYSAYKDNTRVFATHRNVSRLDVELYALDIESVLRFNSDDWYGFAEDFTPAPGRFVRQWAVNVQSQPNQRRYELLLLSAEGGDGIANIECIGAPDPILQLGATGMVSENDPRPLRVRSLPNLQGEILGEISPLTTFTVIDGPICADGYIWWNIEVAETGLVGWSAEGTQGNYFVEMVDSVGEIITEADPADYPGLAPGAYFLTLTAPETARLGYAPIEHVALVATVNLTIKFTPDQVMVWATDMETGEPVADVPVQFYDPQFGLLGRLNTSADGVALLEVPRFSQLYESVYAVVQTEEHFGVASTRMESGLGPWSFGVNGDWEPQQLTTYLYTDRPLYRPGQPVYFRGVVRNQDDVDFTLPDMDQVTVAVYDPEEQVVYEGVLPLTPYGTFSDEFSLDDGAALGYYRLSVEFPNMERRNVFSVGFNVGEYVAPEFQVAVTPAADAYVQGDDIEVLIEADYFFGGAVSDATVEWSVLTRNYWFEYDGEGRYDFTDFNYDEGPGEFYSTYGELIADGVDMTDAEGNFLLRIPADLGDKAQSQELTIEARVIDESDQLVAGRTTVIVHQGEVYVGLRPEQYIGQAEQETNVNLIAVDWGSLPIEDQEIDYEVVKRVWSSVQEEDPTGRTVFTWEVEEIPVDDGAGTVTTDADGLATVSFIPPESGTYKVYATTEDSLGNDIRSSTFLWVSGSSYVAWRQQNSNRFDLISDADEYEVGDTAEILIASPFQGETTALVTIERGGILQHEVINMTSNSEVYRIPITADHAPNIFVSVVIVKGEDEANSYSEFRMGMIQLNVDTERLKLNIDIESDVEPGAFAGPGDEVTYTIRTTDWEGNPVSAEVGIGLTDLAVLSIAPPNSGLLMDFFYYQRGVAVRTGTTLTLSVDKATQTIIDTVKGGGGGGDDAGIFDIREEFVDTPAWEPDVVTDENGEATITVTLPDNLTTWRLDARGVTDGAAAPMLVGETTFDLLSTKPLLVRPLTPRFMVVGDTVQLGAIVNNNTDEAQTVEISLQGTGFTLVEGNDLSQTVDIPAGNRQRVNWMVTILDVPSVDLTFFANGNDGAFTDATKPTVSQGAPLPVYKYEVSEFVGTGGTLTEAGSRSELVVLPHRFEVNDGELTVQVDRSLAAATVGGLDYLQNFEHQCTEQTVSRFLPNVMTARALNSLGLFDPDLQADLDREVSFALQRLYATQKPSGAWGWFPQSEASGLVTAYALLGLAEARSSGYNVDARVINDAAAYIQGEIDVFNTRLPRWRADRQAFYLYAMARAGFFNASAASVVYDIRLSLSNDAKAFLAMAMHIFNPDDPRLEALTTDFISNAILSSTGAHWEDPSNPFNWVTNTRTTALVMDALVQIVPDNDLIPQAVRWLMVARNGDHWETTQETAWAVMALTDWMVESGELRPDYTFNFSFNGDPQDFADNTATADNVTDSEVLRFAVAELLKDEANRLTFSRTEGQGNLYYTAFLNAYLPVEEVEPVSRGLIIDRKYYRVERSPDGVERELVTGGTVGEEIEVVLSIIVPNDLYYVVVEDPIPAGSAAIDPGLLTNSAITSGPRLDGTLTYGWGWWWFSRTEFRDEKVVMYADYLPGGTYEFRYSIRLGLEGEYKVIPPTGHEFYFPDVYGRGAGTVFTIEAAPEE